MSTLLAHRVCNSGEQGIAVIRTVMTHSVDEKSRRAVDATAYSTHEILAHALQIGTLGEGALDLRRWNAQQRRIFGKMLIIERLCVANC